MIDEGSAENGRIGPVSALPPPPAAPSPAGHRTRAFLVACAWLLAGILFGLARWLVPSVTEGRGLRPALLLPLIVFGSLLALAGAFTAFVSIFGAPREGREPYVLAAVLAIGANLFALLRFVSLLARALVR